MINPKIQILFAFYPYTATFPPVFEMFDKSFNTVTFSKSKQTELQEKKEKSFQEAYTQMQLKPLSNWSFWKVLRLAGLVSNKIWDRNVKIVSFSPHRGLVFSLCLLNGLGSPKSNLSKLLSSFLEQQYRGQGRAEKGRNSKSKKYNTVWKHLPHVNPASLASEIQMNQKESNITAVIATH